MTSVLADPARFRRLATGTAFLVAGVLTFLGMLATPWEVEPTLGAYLDALAAHPHQAQVAALLLHFGFMGWAPAVFGALALTRARGVALGHLAAVCAAIGATTMPGLLLSDWYDLAIAQTLPRPEAIALAETAAAAWGVPLVVIPSVVGATLALVLIAVALWRAGHVAGWVPVVMGAGTAVTFTMSTDLVGAAAGSGLLLVALATIGIRVLRTPDEAWLATPVKVTPSP